MTNSTNRRLIRTTSRFAFFVALAGFFAVPGIFFWTALSYEHGRLHADAEAHAAGIAKLVYSDPEHWRFQEIRLEEMLAHDMESMSHARMSVLALDGQEIIAMGQPVGFPSLGSEASIDDGHGTLATVVVARSLWPLVFNTGGVALISLALSLAVFFTLKILPLRALKLVVSDLEQSEARLRAEKYNAEVANRSKSEFLANMSHELRTPLNAVIGFSEMIQMEPFGPLGSPQYRDYIGDIHGAGQHLLAIINDILDLSKLEAGMEELQEEYVEIADLVESAQSLVRQRAEHGRLAFELDLPAGLPLLRADGRRLKQILVNLLTNSVKFTEPGGKVTLKVRCEDGHGHVFQVIDTGIGIAPNDIPKALSMFGQADSGLSRQYEGTGLGLPLTKALVDLHGGSFDLQSELGVGTTVTLGFPANRVVRAPLAPRDTETLRTADQLAV